MVEELKSLSNQEDQSQIAFSDFKTTMTKYGAKLSKNEYHSLLMAFPGQEGGNKGPRINIARIYDQ